MVFTSKLRKIILHLLLIATPDILNRNKWWIKILTESNFESALPVLPAYSIGIINLKETHFVPLSYYFRGLFLVLMKNVIGPAFNSYPNSC